MNLITLDEARDHCKAEGDDDDLLVVYCNAAESLCARLANRSLFVNTAALNAAVATVGTRMAAAYTAYDAAILSADTQDDDRVAVMLKSAAQSQLATITSSTNLLWYGSLNTILAALQASGGGSFNLTCQSLSGRTVSGGGGMPATHSRDPVQSVIPQPAALHRPHPNDASSSSIKRPT